MCIFYVCFIRIELCEKIARKCSSKMVNNFECIVKTLFVRKLSQEFFAKHHDIKSV